MKINDIQIAGLGAKCREARLRYQAKHNKTVEEVAREIGSFKRSHLYKIESDDPAKGVNVETLEKMEKLYNEKLWIRPQINQQGATDQ